MDEREKHDIQRSEEEGFRLQEMDSQHFLYLFLGRVQRMFQEEVNAKHIEDVVTKVVGEMSKAEKERFEREKIGEDLNSNLKQFLGEEDWQKLETLERNRILEHDRHESEGVG